MGIKPTDKLYQLSHMGLSYTDTLLQNHKCPMSILIPHKGTREKESRVFYSKQGLMFCWDTMDLYCLIIGSLLSGLISSQNIHTPP